MPADTIDRTVDKTIPGPREQENNEPTDDDTEE